MSAALRDRPPCAPVAELIAAERGFLAMLGNRYWRVALADSPEDFAQDVVAYALARARTYGPDRLTGAANPVRTWLGLIARTVAVNGRRRLLGADRHGPTVPTGRPADPDRRPWVELVPDRNAESPAYLAAVDQAEVRARIARTDRRVSRVASAVGRLPPRTRSAIRRRFGLGEYGGRELTYREIDPRVKPGTNKEAVQRGLRNLRRALEPVAAELLDS